MIDQKGKKVNISSIPIKFFEAREKYVKQEGGGDDFLKGFWIFLPRSVLNLESQIN
jgi:hypothetical protein